MTDAIVDRRPAPRRRLMLAVAATAAVVTATIVVGAQPSQPTAAASQTEVATVDTYVSAASPTASFGTAKVLDVASSPEAVALLRFAAPTVTSVSSATLRIRNTAGADGGIQVHTTGTGWSATTTYKTAPASGATVAYSNPYTADGWVSIDVTSAVHAGSGVNFALTTMGAATTFSSSRGSSAPQLVVTGQASTPTPKPTATATPKPTPTPTPKPTTGFSVSGKTLVRNGAAYLARGFNMVGVLSPPGCTQGTGVTARKNFGDAELTTAAKQWDANTLRFQVSQSGLSTTDASARSAYIAQIKNDVALAHSHGFAVILSMQDQSIGCGPVHPLPSSATVTAWSVLAPAFANDPSTMYELFNEPQNGTTTADWAQWKNGGTTPLSNEGDTAVGMETLVHDIRADGADNVLLADGANHAEHLDNIPLLTDTGGGRGIVYAAHPYYFSPGQAYWTSSFGYLAATAPVMVTEWNYTASDCGTSSETLAPSFLAYLQSHNIGITGHAFDITGTLIANWSWTATQCGSAVGGSGAVLKQYFARLAG